MSRRTGTETRYFHTGLKNTDSLTNPGQTVAASRIYDAFGNVTSSSGTWSGPFGYAGNFGYQADASGLKLLGHRYYDPSTGRFLTRDPIKDGRNWYAYGAGIFAPTVSVDPTGLTVNLDLSFGGGVIVGGRIGGGLMWDPWSGDLGYYWGSDVRAGAFGEIKLPLTLSWSPWNRVPEEYGSYHRGGAFIEVGPASVELAVSDDGSFDPSVGVGVEAGLGVGVFWGGGAQGRLGRTFGLRDADRTVRKFIDDAHRAADWARRAWQEGWGHGEGGSAATIS